MNFSDYNNTIGNVTTATPEKPAFNCYDHNLYFIRVVTDVWISLPLATAGILGNLMAFIVLCFYRQKLSTTILLQALALVDTLILLSVIPLRSMRITAICFSQPASFDGLFKDVYKHMFYWMFPTLFVLRMIDTWIITLLTFDRWIAVCKPLQAQHLCRHASTYKRIAIVIVASLIFSFPRYLESNQYGIPDHVNPQWGLNKWYVYIYKIGLFFMFMYMIPTTLLLTLNIKLLVSLRVTDPVLMSRRHSTKCGNALSSQHRSITVIVVAVVTIYFICSILAITSQIIYSIQQIEGLKHIEITWLSNVNNIFITFNSASNFFIYCFCSRNFRGVMYRTFGCQNKIRKLRFFGNASGRTSTSNGNSDTTSSLLHSNTMYTAKYTKQNSTSDML